ncbi:fimbrial protein [Variovorax sp. M-6]|uniref:fimbrial protein n=1 Tax=Variovorax sp. M-6 TaxID=3233041 RepID=UPI003F9AF8E5
MNHKLLSTLILASTAMVAQVASAHDGTITFNGQVTAQTCTINGNGTGAKDFTVTLPSVSTSALAAAGQTAGRTAFNIALSACTPDSGNVHTYFEPGLTTDGATGNLKLDAGGANNVQIGLLNGDFTPIKAGFADASQNSKPVSITGGSATLSYYAQYVANGAAAGAGAANSSVLYTLVYQ